MSLLRRAAASRLPVAVVTSSTREEAEASLRALGVLSLLQVIIGKDMVRHNTLNPKWQTWPLGVLSLLRVLIGKDMVRHKSLYPKWQTWLLSRWILASWRLTRTPLVC